MECLINKKFNRLTPILYDGKTKSGNSKYICLCECGKNTTVVGSKLKNGTTKSCGCFRRGLKVVHGLSNTHKREYTSWRGMRSRCNCKSATQYHDYGGRGIKVCKRWDSFKNFYDDMGERPKGKTLDRIDCDGDYSPNNCKWSTYSEQQYNRRDRK